MGILYKHLNYWSSVLGRGGERRKGEWVRREAEKHGKKAAFRAEGISCFGRGEHLPTGIGSISLWTEGASCFGWREGSFLEHKNALGTTNALFYFLGRGGSWAAVKLGFTTVYASSAAPSFAIRQNLLVALLM